MANTRRKYTSVILTDTLEMYIIEVPKIKENNEEEKELKDWLTFLDNPEKVELIGMSKENEEAIKKAKKVLEEISADEHERYLAHLREKYIMDQKAIQEYGYDNGLEDGIRKVAKEMLKQKFTIENIMSVTGLTKEEIEKLK